MANPPNSYKDPYWTNLSTMMEKKHGLPAGLLVNIVQKGEKTDNDRQSPVGAKTVYQIMPNTRGLFLKKYGVDAFASPQAAAEVAALHLKESLGRNNGDVNLAVREYHGGPNRKGWGRVNNAYVGRVLGGEQQQSQQPRRSWNEVAGMIGNIKQPNRQPAQDKINRLVAEHDRMVKKQEAPKAKTVDQVNQGVGRLLAAYDAKQPPKPQQPYLSDKQGNVIDLNQQQNQQPERTLGQQLGALPETALSLGSSLIAAPVGQAVGTFKGMAKALVDGTFGTQEGAQQILQEANKTAHAFSYEPDNAVSQEQLQSVGNVIEDTGLNTLPPVLGGLGTATGSLARAGATQAAPAVQSAAQAVARPIANTGQAVRSGVGRVAETLGLAEAPAQRQGANMGAAQVNPASMRTEQFIDLPIPIERVTQGQVSRDPMVLKSESEAAKLPVGEEFRKVQEGQHEIVNMNLDQFNEMTGAELMNNPVSVGLKVDSALKAEMAKDNARVNNAYDIANKSSEANALVDLNLKLKDNNGRLTPEVNDDLSKLGVTATRNDGDIKTVPNGISILHGSGNDLLTLDNIEIIRANGQKQGKKGRVYGGFYGADKAALAEAEGYAAMQGGTPTVYEVRIAPNTKVLEKTGDITRLSENYINELKKDGVGVVVGKDPRGRTEYAVIDKDAISTVDKFNPNAGAGSSIIDYLNSQPDLKSTPIIGDAKKIAVSLGIAKKDSDGNLIPLQASVRQMEDFRKEINANTNYDKPNIRQSAILKDYIDAHTEAVAGAKFKAARMERTKFAKKWESNKIIGDLIKNKRGTEDRITPLENIQKKVVYGGSLEDLRKVKRTLLTSGDEGKQAWKEIQGSVIQKIKDAATASIAADAEGRQMVSPAKLNSEIMKLDQGGKLDYLFGKRGADQLRNLNDVSKALFTVPMSAGINHSNTASAMAIVLDSIASGAATGLPLPLITVLKEGAKRVKDAKQRKAINKSIINLSRGSSI